MLRPLGSLIGHRMMASDGEFGKVKDVYFDSQAWKGRYLVVDTGGWLRGRKVLIPLTEIDLKQMEDDRIPVALTKQQIENSPPIDTDRPVSRQYEEELHTFFEWEPYWSPGPLYPAEGVAVPELTTVDDVVGASIHGDPNLRSFREVVGYDVVGVDGELGEVADCIIDDESWAIQHFAVHSGHGSHARQFLLAVHWVERISWPDSCLIVNMVQDDVRHSPSWLRGQEIDPDYESRLRDHAKQKTHAVD